MKDQLTSSKIPGEFGRSLLGWFDKNREYRPWRHDFATKSSPYPIWVSEVMLQQTTISAVQPVYAKFMHLYPNVFALAAAKLEEVLNSVKGLGYYQRFRSLHRAAQDFVNLGASHSADSHHDINWPKTYNEWLSVPGIGPYTAGAISSIVLGEVRAAVDGNVERILSRIHEIKTPIASKGVKEFIKLRAESLVCSSRPGDFNEALMELGQKICKRSQPSCSICPLNRFCLAYKNNSQKLSPGKPVAKINVERVYLTATVHMWKRKLALIRRDHPGDRFLKNTVGFPLVEVTKANPIEPEVIKDSEKLVKRLKEYQFRHRITNYDLGIHVELVRHERKPPQTKRFLWKELDESQRIISTSLDQKILAELTKILS